MTLTVFFSWQSDHQTKSGRNLIESALQKAVGRIDADLEEADRNEIVVDKDTNGVPGHAPIVDTIFRKIDNAAIFIPDLTFVGQRADGRPTPNPNVLIEYGWALKSLGHSRIIPIMNVAHGAPSDATLPFDMKHLRHPLQYDCPDDADESKRKTVKEQLSREIEAALRLIFESEEFKASLTKPPEPPLFIANDPKDGPGRFRASGDPVGIIHGEAFNPGAGQDVNLALGPVIWLRVMPVVAPLRTWQITELEKCARHQGQMLLPITFGSFMSFNFVRGEDGFGTFAISSNQPGETTSLVYAFRSGEVWSIDSYLLEAVRNRPLPMTDIEKYFVSALNNHVSFLGQLGINPPLRWIAGIEDAKGRKLGIPARQGYVSMYPDGMGHCMSETIVDEGTIADGQTAKQAIRPFFEGIFDACGIERPEWMG